jgi:hypothetical protein
MTGKTRGWHRAWARAHDGRLLNVRLDRTATWGGRRWPGERG